MIQLKKVSKIYKSGIAALSDINLIINNGEFVLLTGASGSGKTSLLKLLCREEKPTSGNIIIDGKDISLLRRSEAPYLRRKFGVVFQDFRLLAGRSIFENVSIPLEVVGMPKGETADRVSEVLGSVRLHHRMEERVDALSAGEQQKVAVARAIVNRPLVLLIDEPLGNLDSESGAEVIDILRDINARGTTLVVATHNKATIGTARLVVLDKGRVLC